MRVIYLLFLLFLVVGAARADAPIRTHYGYILFLKHGTSGDALSKARRVVPAALRHHRLSSPATARSWDGAGAIPIAFEERPVSAETLDEDTTHDSGEPLRDVLKTPRGKNGSSLVIIIGYPRALNVAAYVEALQLVMDVSEAIESPAFADGETGEVLRTESLGERRTAGRKGGNLPVSAKNPPAITIMEGMTSYEQLAGGGWRTWGMNKLGLPDIVVESWIPDTTIDLVFQTIGSLLVSNKIAATPGASFRVSGNDPEVAEALWGRALRDAVAPLRSASAKGHQPGTVPGELWVDFPGAANTHLYERQMLFIETLMGPRYPSFLGPTESRAIAMAVARAKGRIQEARGRYTALKEQGQRVFVAVRIDSLVKDASSLGDGLKRGIWMEVLQWNADGSMELRKWQGDPRHSGHRFRLEPPLVAGDRTFEYLDSTGSDGMVEDILTLDRNGIASGGEVVSMVERLADRAR